MTPLRAPNDVHVGCVELYSNGNACFAFSCSMERYLFLLAHGFRGLCVDVFTDDATAFSSAMKRSAEMKQSEVDRQNAAYWAQRARAAVQKAGGS